MAKVVINHLRIDMGKRLATILFLVALVTNTLGVFPPHRDGEGGCEAECCQAARQGGPNATMSGICCITECRQSAEFSTSTTALLNSIPNQTISLVGSDLSTLIQKPLLRQPRFPSSPTRFLNGSSSRYLETRSLLI